MAVDKYQVAGGSWLRLALKDVAGSGDIVGVSLAPSSVSCGAWRCRCAYACAVSDRRLVDMVELTAWLCTYTSAAGMLNILPSFILHVQSPDAWTPMQHSFGAAWEASNLPPPPLDLQATDSSGQQVVARCGGCCSSTSSWVLGCRQEGNVSLLPAGRPVARCFQVPLNWQLSLHCTHTNAPLCLPPPARVCRRVLQQAGAAGTFPTDVQFQAIPGLASTQGSTATIPATPPPASPPTVTFESLFGLPPKPSPAAAASPPPAPAEGAPPEESVAVEAPIEGSTAPPPETLAPVESTQSLASSLSTLQLHLHLHPPCTLSGFAYSACNVKLHSHSLHSTTDGCLHACLRPLNSGGWTVTCCVLPSARCHTLQVETSPTLQPAPAPSPEVQPPSPEAISPAPPPLPEAAAPAPESPAPVPQPEQQLTVQLVTAQPVASSLPLAAAVPSPEVAVPPVGAPATSPAFALPPPAPAAPEIVDTRPPRPPGVGPSISPAPVVYSPETGLPTVRQLPPTSGPASPAQLVDPGFNDTCSTIGEVLARIPEASNWTQLVTVSWAAGCEGAAQLVSAVLGSWA